MEEKVMKDCKVLALCSQKGGIAFTFFSGWHTGGKSIFMADTITDPADFMVAPLIGNILVMINKTCCIKDDVVMNVVFVNMGTDHVFIFSFQYFVCKLLP